MILGLPFLSYNDIIVDAAARTAIDKKCGFDLLHPTPPSTRPVKKKLKQFFKELQEDRKLMVAELNMVCHDRLRHTMYKFEQVKPVDPIAAIRQRIEILAAQKELEKLGTQMKSELMNSQRMFIVEYNSKTRQNVCKRIHIARLENTVRHGPP
jgi:hypothetical protein